MATVRSGQMSSVSMKYWSKVTHRSENFILATAPTQLKLHKILLTPIESGNAHTAGKPARSLITKPEY